MADVVEAGRTERTGTCGAALGAVGVVVCDKAQPGGAGLVPVAGFAERDVGSGLVAVQVVGEALGHSPAAVELAAKIRFAVGARGAVRPAEGVVSSDEQAGAALAVAVGRARVASLAAREGDHRIQEAGAGLVVRLQRPVLGRPHAEEHGGLEVPRVVEPDGVTELVRRDRLDVDQARLLLRCD